jgi:hypothetical protein
MDGSIFIFDELKTYEDEELQYQTQKYYYSDTKIYKSYEKIMNEFSVLPRESLVFSYRVENRCGIQGEDSEFAEYCYGCTTAQGKCQDCTGS